MSAEHHVAWSGVLRNAGPGEPGEVCDPRATVRAVAQVVRRARGGGRLDDIVRGPMTVNSGLWVLSRLHRDGTAPIDPVGTVRRLAGTPSTRDDDGAPGLVDLTLADGLVDWDVLSEVLARRTYAPDPELHQSFDTFASLRRRLAVMDYYDDLHGRTVLQLGDDEMFGVAIGLADGVRHVHVADTDERVLRSIGDEADRLALPLTTHAVDVRHARPELTDVDTFFVSGLKDPGGLFLFVATALSTVPGAGAVGYVSFDLDVYRADGAPGQDEEPAQREILRMFDRLDCTVTALLPGDDGLLDDSVLADLGAATREAARRAASPTELGAWLRSLLARRPAGADLLRYQPGFPHAQLRPISLARVETGPASRRLASRYLRFLQSAAPTVRRG
ncbi:bis-aminopropyl spermidine synthase family protein [Streptomyces sp. MBT97]|uniref:bis-aminopropyl spermidine synthase family protein n=1 Tax=Streptomyces sp. MBT97 TaxID=2800411 RepID=UPI00190D0250|nr:bis-aminopropyl spermidine synthase family protein [Streptomyces sp. MBT97]MBK3631382.1 bis-aminopropyl spermidine synthase family protein [Streptomyces sp. MBT97]